MFVPLLEKVRKVAGSFGKSKTQMLPDLSESKTSNIYGPVFFGCFTFFLYFNVVLNSGGSHP